MFSGLPAIPLGPQPTKDENRAGPGDGAFLHREPPCGTKPGERPGVQPLFCECLSPSLSLGCSLSIGGVLLLKSCHPVSEATHITGACTHKYMYTSSTLGCAHPQVQIFRHTRPHTFMQTNLRLRRCTRTLPGSPSCSSTPLHQRCLGKLISPWPKGQL